MVPTPEKHCVAHVATRADGTTRSVVVFSGSYKDCLALILNPPPVHYCGDGDMINGKWFIVSSSRFESMLSEERATGRAKGYS